jgi:hypothetical protein
MLDGPGKHVHDSRRTPDAMASELVEAARSGRLEEFSEQVADLFDVGHLASVGPSLSALNDPPLAVLVLLSDLRARVGAVELYDLAELDRRVRASNPGSDLSRWMTAILTEWGLWRGDLSTAGYGRDPLVDDESDASRLARICEARRLRVEALSTSVTEPGSSRGVELADQVRHMLSGAPCEEELAFTDVVLGYGSVAITDDLSVVPLSMVRHGADTLAQLDADRLPFGLACLAFSEYMIGDVDHAIAVLDRFDHLQPTAAMPPLIREGAEMLRALTDVSRGGDHREQFAVIGRHFDLMRQRSVPPFFVAPVANDLLDLGETELTTRVVATAGSVLSFVRPAHQAMREVEARLRILRDHDRAAIDELWSLYDEWETDGRKRRAAASAVRCSWTARAGGFEEEADTLYQWGVDRLPPEEERTNWERDSVAGVRASSRRTTSDHSLMLLAPDCVVIRDGHELKVGDAQAKLLSLLVTARRPVTTDWIVTAMWDDVVPEAGRNRLAAILHRLRQRLSLAPDELIRRTRHGIELDGSGWDIDVWHFWELSGGSTEERCMALALYRYDLVGRQLAYDDAVEAERDRLRERWLETVRSVVEAGAMSVDEANATAQRLGMAELPY